MDEDSGFFDAHGQLVENHTSAPELIHQSAGGWSLLYRFDKGGRFRVYKALKPEYRGKQPYESLLRKEFEIGYALSHPNICEVYGFCFLPELGNAIEMEWIDGRTLTSLLEQGVPAQDLSEKLIGQLCDALEYLHNRQVIHRDIKPSNIIVTGEGEVYLLDMNAAKWYEPDSSDDSRHIGTWHYAAPEQAGYGLKASSAKSDIYALGVLMNVMLTGDVPKQKQAPEPYWGVIEKCISLEADARYNAKELSDVLEKISRRGKDNA